GGAAEATAGGFGAAAAPAQAAEGPAAPAPAVPATALSTPDPVIDQVTRHLLTARTLRDGTQRSVLHLTPGRLGAVTVTVDVRAGQVRLDLAASDGALAALTQDLPQLRTQLADAGLDLADVTLNRQDTGAGDGRRPGQEATGGTPSGDPTGADPSGRGGTGSAPRDGSRGARTDGPTGTPDPGSTAGTASAPVRGRSTPTSAAAAGRVDVLV
ncbi:MAG: flagellar hook-length control protein FliK, partial [Kineosporiaceae bacterium]